MFWPVLMSSWGRREAIMTFKVLIPDNVNQKAIDLFASEPEFEVIGTGGMDRAATLAAISEADALIIRSATRVDAEMLSVAAKLKAIARAGVGVDNVDLDAATQRGVAVMNTPDGNTIAAAEHAFGLMLALARHVPQAHASMVAGRWDRKAFMGTELRGKTLGLIGLGRIGQAVAIRARAFEMEVLGYDPKPREARELDIEIVSLDDLYARSDFISLHPSLTDETRGMIHADAIAKMKPGVRIINVARGPVIVDEALAAGLESGQVAGAALDVYDQEPPAADNPLIGHPAVVHTPHLGASTRDAQVNVAIDAARQIIDGLKTGQYQNVVNQAVLA